MKVYSVIECIVGFFRVSFWVVVSRGNGAFVGWVFSSFFVVEIISEFCICGRNFFRVTFCRGFFAYCIFFFVFRFLRFWYGFGRFVLESFLYLLLNELRWVRCGSGWGFFVF